MRRRRRLVRVLWVATDRFNRNDGSAMAGFIAFSGLLSLFPFLIFAATLTGIWVGSDRSDCALRQQVPIRLFHPGLKRLFGHTFGYNRKSRQIHGIAITRLIKSQSQRLILLDFLHELLQIAYFNPE